MIRISPLERVLVVVDIRWCNNMFHVLLNKLMQPSSIRGLLMVAGSLGLLTAQQMDAADKYIEILIAVMGANGLVGIVANK